MTVGAGGGDPVHVNKAHLDGEVTRRQQDMSSGKGQSIWTGKPARKALDVAKRLRAGRDACSSATAVTHENRPSAAGGATEPPDWGREVGWG